MLQSCTLMTTALAATTRGGGVLRFELDRGVPLKPKNPYPSLRVILAKKVPIFKDFPSKIGLFFKNSAIFGVSAW